VIRIVEQPLSELAVHAVLRAADDRLVAVGPASARLDERGGERLQAQLRVQAPLEVGSAIVTGAGDLAAEFVLHVIVQGAERAASRETVRRALTSAWHRAESWELPLVAAPLGGLSLSPEEAALLLVETFRGRPRASGFPAELYVVLDHPEQRGAIAPLLALGAQ
jgi:O-acetyl-ADP-ribose deacetylase (regulator of RNase III)